MKHIAFAAALLATAPAFADPLVKEEEAYVRVFTMSMFIAKNCPGVSFDLLGARALADRGGVDFAKFSEATFAALEAQLGEYSNRRHLIPEVTRIVRDATSFVSYEVNAGTACTKYVPAFKEAGFLKIK